MNQDHPGEFSYYLKIAFLTKETTSGVVAVIASFTTFCKSTPLDGINLSFRFFNSAANPASAFILS